MVRVDEEETLGKESDYIGQVSFYSYWLAAFWAPQLILQAADRDGVLNRAHPAVNKDTQAAC